jgi:hypothetical protein
VLTINPLGFLLVFAPASSRMSGIVHLLDKSSATADLLLIISELIHLICCPIRVRSLLTPMAKCLKIDYLVIVVVILAAGSKTVFLATKFGMLR